MLISNFLLVQAVASDLRHHDILQVISLWESRGRGGEGLVVCSHRGKRWVQTEGTERWEEERGLVPGVAKKRFFHHSRWASLQWI